MKIVLVWSLVKLLGDFLGDLLSFVYGCSGPHNDNYLLIVFQPRFLILIDMIILLIIITILLKTTVSITFLLSFGW